MAVCPMGKTRKTTVCLSSRTIFVRYWRTLGHSRFPGYFDSKINQLKLLNYVTRQTLVYARGEMKQVSRNCRSARDIDIAFAEPAVAFYCQGSPPYPHCNHAPAMAMARGLELSMLCPGFMFQRLATRPPFYNGLAAHFSSGSVQPAKVSNRVLSRDGRFL